MTNIKYNIKYNSKIQWAHSYMEKEEKINKV